MTGDRGIRKVGWRLEKRRNERERVGEGEILEYLSDTVVLAIAIGDADVAL